MADVTAAAGASLEVTLGRIADRMDREDRRQRRLDQLLHPEPITGVIPLSAGAGTLDQPDMYGPRDGYWWDVRRITVDGFTAGTVAVYRNNVNTAKIANFTQAGEWTWSGQMMLRMRERLLFVATGITGSVQVDGDAFAISAQVLADYLM